MTDCGESRQRLARILAAALQSVEGRAAVRRALAARPIAEPAWLCAIGKAAESMALGACDSLGATCAGGLLITKSGHLNQSRLGSLGIESLVGGHPVPTAASLDAGARLLAALREAPTDATLLFLLSGGASSLVEVPVAGFDLADLQRLNRWLLGSGLPIEDMNLVRKSVSRIKAGGLLGYLADRPIRQLAISDVPGDRPGVIGSGLLTPEPDLARRARHLDLPDWLADWIRHGLIERASADRLTPATPPDRPPAMELVATLTTAMNAALEAARREGVTAYRHESLVQGDAVERGRSLARALMEGPPGLHLWGGETTVRLPESPGRGGRNQHLVLAAAVELAGRDDCLLLSAGTDGTDGPTNDAGALVDGGTLGRAQLAGLDALDCLERADSGTFLEASGDLIDTGPTGTNVMDLILGLKL
ncbi:hydroxypyruvate reductase [Thiocystis minor]|uniref:glycerate kinase type-2 family protein n=1 Tax=Thiocystis minor TaxID=61597 RepID=UPI0019145ACD|nr:DUF4147 domain-containing protein [Thiocystis minor]MBK5963569.1 hydroxypyruvate reductase [Thiocystis minor]